MSSGGAASVPARPAGQGVGAPASVAAERDEPLDDHQQLCMRAFDARALRLGKCTYAGKCRYVHRLSALHEPPAHRAGHAGAFGELSIEFRDWGTGDSPLFACALRHVRPTKLTKALLRVGYAGGPPPFELRLCFDWLFLRAGVGGASRLERVCARWQNCWFLHVDEPALSAALKRHFCRAAPGLPLRCRGFRASAGTGPGPCPYAHRPQDLRVSDAFLHSIDCANARAAARVDASALTVRDELVRVRVYACLLLETRGRAVALDGYELELCHDPQCEAEQFCDRLHVHPAHWTVAPINAEFARLKIKWHFARPWFSLQKAGGREPKTFGDSAVDAAVHELRAAVVEQKAADEAKISALAASAPSADVEAEWPVADLPKLRSSSVPGDWAAAADAERWASPVHSPGGGASLFTSDALSSESGTRTDSLSAASVDEASGGPAAVSLGTLLRAVLYLPPQSRDFDEDDSEFSTDEGLAERLASLYALSAVSARWRGVYERWLASAQVGWKLPSGRDSTPRYVSHPQLSISEAGTASTVFFALRLSDGADVALKIVSQEYSRMTESDLEASFAAEQRALRSRAGVPGIVSIYESFEMRMRDPVTRAKRVSRVVVLELMEGTLKELVSAWRDAKCTLDGGGGDVGVRGSGGGDLVDGRGGVQLGACSECVHGGSPAHLLAVQYVTSSLLSTLDELNNRAVDGNMIVHRDVKPDNVLLDRDLRVRLIDFGSSTLIERLRDNKTLDKQSLASMVFAAPEAVNQRYAHRTSDLYALGIMVFYMATLFEIDGPEGRGQPWPVGQAHNTDWATVALDRLWPTTPGAARWPAHAQHACRRLCERMVIEKEEERCFYKELKFETHGIMLTHPFLWSARKKANFLVQVALVQSKSLMTELDKAVVKALNAAAAASAAKRDAWPGAMTGWPLLLQNAALVADAEDWRRERDESRRECAQRGLPFEMPSAWDYVRYTHDCLTEKRRFRWPAARSASLMRPVFIDSVPTLVIELWESGIKNSTLRNHPLLSAFFKVRAVPSLDPPSDSAAWW